MSDFGEPWRIRSGWPVDADGHDVFSSGGNRVRAAACVVALAGIADPAAFVERAKAMERWLLTTRPEGLAVLSTFNMLTPAEIAALAVEWQEDA